MRSTREAHINEFVAAARHEGQLDDTLHRQAATIVRKIKARNDKDDQAVWDELQDRLDARGHDVGWMTDHGPHATADRL
jgi:hypothetical protein